MPTRIYLLLLFICVWSVASEPDRSLGLLDMILRPGSLILSAA